LKKTKKPEDDADPEVNNSTQVKSGMSKSLQDIMTKNRLALRKYTEPLEPDDDDSFED